MVTEEFEPMQVYCPLEQSSIILFTKYCHLSEFLTKMIMVCQIMLKVITSCLVPPFSFSLFCAKMIWHSWVVCMRLYVLSLGKLLEWHVCLR
jgi:hypothetical protein